jgi:hypothetical protein
LSPFFHGGSFLVGVRLFTPSSARLQQLSALLSSLSPRCVRVSACVTISRSPTAVGFSWGLVQ